MYKTILIIIIESLMEKIKVFFNGCTLISVQYERFEVYIKKKNSFKLAVS